MKKPSYDIILVAETFEDRLLPSSLELLGFGRALLSHRRGSMALLIAGSDMKSVVRGLSQKSGIDILALENRHLNYNNHEVLQKAVSFIINEYRPLYICFMHSVSGSALASAIAAETGASCITSVESVGYDHKCFSFTRRIYGGKFQIDISPQVMPLVITISPGSFPANKSPDLDLDKGPGINLINFDYEPRGITARGNIKNQDQLKRLDEADVIISAGRGIRRKENIELIERISRLFKNSAIGASRPACDMGWLSYSNQIGLTGRTVSPRLYMACGISGSPQHIAGMKNSMVIVSINSDPDAAIFAYSHYIIIDDVQTFLPVLETKINEIIKI